MSYYELIPGLDCTVFASYYEPWGYTPLESVAFGVPTITTDLAGFGQWVLADFDNAFEVCGVKVLHRTDSNYSELVDQIAYNVYALFSAPATDIAKVRNAAMATSKAASWDNFAVKYVEAYKQALENLHKCGK